MKKTFALAVVLGLTMILVGEPVYAKKKKRHRRQGQGCSLETRQETEKIIRRVAAEEGVCPDLLAAVAKCESGFCPNAVGDGGKSLGALQIQPQHHPLTRAQCFDVETSARYAARQIKAGRGRAWTCYRTETRKRRK